MPDPFDEKPCSSAVDRVTRRDEQKHVVLEKLTFDPFTKVVEESIIFPTHTPTSPTDKISESYDHPKTEDRNETTAEIPEKLAVFAKFDPFPDFSEANQLSKLVGKNISFPMSTQLPSSD